MGIQKYFRNSKPASSAASTVIPLQQASPPNASQDQSCATSLSGAMGGLDIVKHEVMLNYLYQQQATSGWRTGKDNGNEGVVLRLARDNYLTYPPRLSETPLLESLKVLNVQCAMTVHSPVIKSFLQVLPDSLDIPLMNGLRVQIVETIEDLAIARTHQFAACVASESLLVVWDDDAMNLLQRAKQIEWELMQLLWTSDPYSSTRTSKAMSKINLVVTEKEVETESDLEDQKPQERPTIFINTFLVTISLCAIITTLGLGARQVIIELMIEKGFVQDPYLRFCFLLLTPIWLFFGMFFFNVLITNIAECIGPIRQMSINSKHYSATTSPRLKSDLPHITIQCPVYKEGLSTVIAGTVQSIKRAISTYELQGGTANIFVNDDGLQLIDPEQRKARIDFYTDHGIGWIARPPHDQNGFQRKGKFKKASNMNFAMGISCSVEDKLKAIDRPQDWTQTDENEAYARALGDTLAEGGNIAWAEGNIRIGDFILIIDSDTRVPSDCLLDAVSELVPCPEVAILQFSSGVMQVVHNYFENGITFFTNLIYSAIRFGVANGDVAPFVGHNAMLRWSALQEVAFQDEDGKMKFWSESHVSEDFDMALRLQIAGYITRLAAWAGDGFKEGVSLTVYDELARWQKYAYGCNELVFHPVRKWIYKGPFTPLFRKFLRSNMPIASKVNIISYIGTYYAIGAAWIMTLANYFVIGWFKGYIDKYYVNSWEIWITLVVVFNGLGNLALATLRYRLGERSFLGALLENFKWLLLCFIFLGGISIHLSQAILCHMFEINMTWGATAKELEFSNFFVEVPKVLRKFWFSMIFCIVMIAALIIFAHASFVPYSWNIQQLEAIVPLASLCFSHFLLPLALNPALMTFAW